MVIETFVSRSMVIGINEPNENTFSAMVLSTNVIGINAAANELYGGLPVYGVDK